MAKDNVLLGELNVPVHPKEGKDDKAQIRYTYDVNGLLEVEVTVASTNTTKKMVIEKDPGAMSQEESRHISDRVLLCILVYLYSNL